MISASIIIGLFGDFGSATFSHGSILDTLSFVEFAPGSECYRGTVNDGSSWVIFSLGIPSDTVSSIYVSGPNGQQHTCLDESVDIVRIDEYDVHMRFSVTECLEAVNAILKEELFPATLTWNKVRGYFYAGEHLFTPIGDCPPFALESTSMVPTDTAESSTPTGTLATTVAAQVTISTTSESTTEGIIDISTAEVYEPKQPHEQNTNANDATPMSFFISGLIIVFL